jgi:general secretion pathway protein L
MASLIIRFHDSTLDDFSWLVSQSENVKQTVDWQTGSEQDLAELAKKHTAVILVLAQQDIYLTSYEVPNKASRQVLSSIEYQIEDQLAQDIEIQHCALGNQSGNPVVIAVIEKVIMLRCITLVQKYGLAVTRIVPEIFLCPWSGNTGEVSVIESHDAVILRYGEYQGIKCHPQLGEEMLDLIAAEREIKVVNYYLQNTESYDSLKVVKYPGASSQLTLEHLEKGISASINLLQRQFQITSVWSKLLRIWKWVLGLFLILIVVGGYNKAIALQQLESRLSDIKTTQYELLKNHLPSHINKSDDLKKELINLLKQSQSGDEEVNFLELLRKFTLAKTSFPSVVVSKIGYQNKRLSIDITSNQLSDIESLLEAIEATGQATKLDNLSIKPDIISGQFVLVGVGE